TWPPGPSPLVGGREKARPQTLAESFIRSIRRDRLRQRPKPKIVVPFCGLVCGIAPNLANKLRFQADCRRKDVRQRRETARRRLQAPPFKPAPRRLRTLE